MMSQSSLYIDIFFCKHTIKPMLRSLIVKSCCPFEQQLRQENLFPESAKQVTNQFSLMHVFLKPTSIASHFIVLLMLVLAVNCIKNIYFLINYWQNSRDTFSNKNKWTQPTLFANINAETGQLHCQIDKIVAYSQDKIKFITKIQYHPQEDNQSDIKIIRNSLFYANGTAYFLLIFDWFPNHYQGKVRKASVHTTNQNKSKIHLSKFAKNKQKLNQSEIASVDDLLQLVYLLSEKIFLDEESVDIFISALQDKSQAYCKQINTISIVSSENVNKKQFTIEKVSTVAESKLRFSSKPQFQEVYMEADIRGSHSHHSARNKSIELKKNQSIKPSDSSRASLLNLSPRFLRHSEKLQLFFTNIQSIQREDIYFNQNFIEALKKQNIQGFSFQYQALQRINLSWSSIKQNYKILFQANMETHLDNAIEKCLFNFQEISYMDLQNFNSKTIDQFFEIVKDFSKDAIKLFFEETENFVCEKSYEQFYRKLLKKLNEEEEQLMQSFAYTKYEGGNRKMSSFEKQKGKGSSSDSMMSRLMGQSEINNLQIGYSNYKRLILPKIPNLFLELASNKYKHKADIYDSKTDKTDYFENLENRIKINQEKKKTLDMHVLLTEREAESLKELLNRYADKKNQEEEIISDHSHKKQ